MEIFELEEFRPGSQNRSDWLPEPYDLRTIRFVFARTFPTKRLAALSQKARVCNKERLHALYLSGWLIRCRRTQHFLRPIPTRSGTLLRFRIGLRSQILIRQGRT